MKIGVFDSGLGGLTILKSIRQLMPDYDYVFYGDTLHVPYGRKSPETILKLTQNGVSALFEQGCSIVIIACNTACAVGLRELQQNWLPGLSGDKRILGVIVPTLETVRDDNLSSVGLLATPGTIDSGVYREELEKIKPDITIIDQAAPLLVPLMENDGWEFIRPSLQKYCARFQALHVGGVILGCTHYGQLEESIRPYLPEGTRILSQNKIVPVKLRDYLERHPAREAELTKGGTTRLLVSDVTEHFTQNTRNFFHPDAVLERA